MQFNHFIFIRNMFTPATTNESINQSEIRYVTMQTHVRSNTMRVATMANTPSLNAAVEKRWLKQYSVCTLLSPSVLLLLATALNIIEGSLSMDFLEATHNTHNNEHVHCSVYSKQKHNLEHEDKQE